MKLKFETFYRGLLLVLVVLLVWSVWQSQAQNSAQGASADAPTATETAVGGTNVATDRVLTPPKLPMPTPEWIEKLAVKLPFLKTTLWGNELWKYIFSLVYIFLAFYVSKLLDYLTRVWLKKLTDRTETKFDDLLLDLLNGPVKVVAFIIFLRIGLDVFDWPEMVQKILAKGFTVVVAIAITYMVLKFIDLLMNYWRQRAAAKEDDAFNKQLFPIIRKSLKFFVVAVAALVTLDNLEVNITAAIASLSIGGLAVGLAAQDTLANLFGGISIFLDKPFRIGDRVQLDGVDGPVESIGLRSTRVRNLDGHLISIPNKTMGNATITNISARPNIKTVMNIGVTYDTPAAKVKRALKIIEEVYKNHPKSFNCIISFNKFESSSLNILVVHWWNSTDFVEYLGGIQEMNLSLKERFDAEGISFAFPTQTLYVKQDSDWRLGESK
ncbi:MAG: mechanosensitive ion channel family protein [Verrucomicrobiae bacterium]|nr:mechanosensitive ion channel family protein [Verrucomicrobiae bacterium]